jgi:hypothetical protein
MKIKINGLGVVGAACTVTTVVRGCASDAGNIEDFSSC